MNEKQYLAALIDEKARRLENKKASADFYEFRKLITPKLIEGWWQRTLASELQSFFNDYKAGLRPRLAIQAPPQHGKLLSDDTPVLTTGGWKKHGDIQPGDYVFSPNGEPVMVLATSEKHYADRRVALSNGESFLCHSRHEWTVFNRNKKRFETLETDSMLDKGKRSNDRIPIYTGILGKRGCHFVYKLPQVKPLNLQPKPLPADPYMLGVWLGDGSQTKPTITHDVKDGAIIAELEKRGFKVSVQHTHKKTGVISTSFGKSKMPEQLKGAGVFVKKYGIRKKHIPEVYLTASIQQRLELLAGLIDTDGYTYNKNGRVVFTTADTALADSFCELISTFGWTFSKVTEQPKKSSSGIMGVNPYFVIGFNPTLEIPCILERKKNTPKGKSYRVSITGIEKLSEPVQGNCIQVDATDGLYLVGKTMQPTHNSIQIIDFIAWLTGHLPDSRIIYTSFSDRLGIRANLRLQRIYDSSKYQACFAGTRINSSNAVTNSSQLLRNRDILEFSGHEGYFRNTTVCGAITGETLDLGIIDDPLKGREQANSKTIRDKTWDWFTDDFFTRFSEDAGLLCILTRWHIDDPIGRLLEKDKSVKLLTYPALAVEKDEHREVGDPLFPELKSKEFLLERKSIMSVSSWESLYQQNPIIMEGNFFKPENIGIVEAVPADIKRWCRAWDFGATTDGDYTVGVKMGSHQGRLIISDVVRFQGAPDDVNRIMLATTQRDGKSVYVRFPQDPGQAGKQHALYIGKLLAGFNFTGLPVSGDKITRAEPFAAQCNIGNVDMIRASWNAEFIEELRNFPNGVDDDQVDAGSDAFSFLQQRQGSVISGAKILGG